MAPTIRRYTDRDHDAVYDICVRTAAAGGDARGLYQTDDLMPDLFAGPYVYLEPGSAFVLDDGGQAVGYVIGTPDTAGFARAYRDRWIPRLAGRYPVPPDPPATPDDAMLALHYHPERLLWPGLARYPSHLHIDLLPPYQGAGHGRALIDTFCAAMAGVGAAGVHVTVVTENTKALGFYRRLGFSRLVDEPGPVVYLGRAILSKKKTPATGELPSRTQGVKAVTVTAVRSGESRSFIPNGSCVTRRPQPAA
jgi:ribosomal protein S18 acetylase RimI-like enzyme